MASRNIIPHEMNGAGRVSSDRQLALTFPVQIDPGLGRSGKEPGEPGATIGGARDARSGMRDRRRARHAAHRDPIAIDNTLTPRRGVGSAKRPFPWHKSDRGRRGDLLPRASEGAEKTCSRRQHAISPELLIDAEAGTATTDELASGRVGAALDGTSGRPRAHRARRVTHLPERRLGLRLRFRRPRTSGRTSRWTFRAPAGSQPAAGDCRGPGGANRENPERAPADLRSREPLSVMARVVLAPSRSAENPNA